MTRPLVSVVIPAYNYARFLPRALDSVLAQDWPHLEVVVVDDGSTDETPDVLRAYADRVVALRQDNAGVNAATAAGLAVARGEFLAMFDADDLCRRDRIRLQVERLLASPRAAMVCSDMAIVDAEERVLAPSYFEHHALAPPQGAVLGRLLADNPVPGPTLMLRRALLDHVLPVGPAAPVQAQDWWLAARAAQVGEIETVRAPLVSYRRHGANSWSSTQELRIRDVRGGNRFRRWMLGTWETDHVPLVELAQARHTLAACLTMMARETGGALAVEAEVSPEQRAAHDTALQEAHAALAADEPDRAARRFLVAWAHDPLDREAELGFAGTVLRLGIRTAAPLVPESLASARERVVLAWARELVADPSLLAAWGAGAGRAADRTLAVMVPDGDVLDALAARLAELGLDGADGPDLLAVPMPTNAAEQAGLLCVAEAVYSARPEATELGVRRYDRDAVLALG